MIKKSKIAGGQSKAGMLHQGTRLADDYELYSKMRNAQLKPQDPKPVEPHKHFRSQGGTPDLPAGGDAEKVRGAAHPSGTNKRNNLSAEEKHQQGAIRTRRRGGKG